MARDFGIFSTNASTSATVPRGQAWDTVQTGDLDELFNPTLMWAVGPAGQAKAGDGNLTICGYSFVADPNTGLYRIGADNLGIAVGGVKKLDISAAGTQFGAAGGRLVSFLTGVAASWNAGSVGPGATVSTTVTVTGAALADFVLSVSYDSVTGTNPSFVATAGQITGLVSLANTVTVVYYNGHASGTVGPTFTNLRVLVGKFA